MKKTTKLSPFAKEILNFYNGRVPEHMKSKNSKEEDIRDRIFDAKREIKCSKRAIVRYRHEINKINNLNIDQINKKLQETLFQNVSFFISDQEFTIKNNMEAIRTLEKVSKLNIEKEHKEVKQGIKAIKITCANELSNASYEIEYSREMLTPELDLVFEKKLALTYTQTECETWQRKEIERQEDMIMGEEANIKAAQQQINEFTQEYKKYLSGKVKNSQSFENFLRNLQEPK